MAETRHKTVIEIRADSKAAIQDIQKVQAALDAARRAANGISVGGGGGAAPRGGAPGGGATAPGGGGTGPAPGGGAGSGVNRSARPKTGRFGAAFGTAANSFAGASPAFAVEAAGAFGSAGLGALGDRLSGSKSKWISSLGSGVASSLPFLGLAAALTGAGVRQQYGIALKKAQIQRMRGVARLAGPGASRSGYGYMPTESAALSQAFAQQVGFRAHGPGSHPNFLRLMTRGVGLGAIAGYRGQLAPGVGGVRSDGNVVRMVAVAMKEGLRGARVDQLLQSIAANTAAIGRQGLNVNVSRMEEFIARMQATGGAFAGQGMRLGTVATGLAGAYADARQTLVGPFAGLAQNAILAKAASSGGGIMGMVQAIEQMQGDPDAARKAMIEMFGGDVAALGFLNMGATSGMAKGLAGKLAAPAFPKLPAGRAAGLTGILASAEAKRLNGMTQKQAEALISGVEGIKSFLATVGDNVGSLLDIINSAVSKFLSDDPKATPEQKKLFMSVMHLDRDSSASHKKTSTHQSKHSAGGSLKRRSPHSVLTTGD